MLSTTTMQIPMQTRKGNTAPMLEIVTPERKKQLDDLINQQKELSSKMNARKKEASHQFAKWLKEAHRIWTEIIAYWNLPVWLPIFRWTTLRITKP